MRSNYYRQTLVYGRRNINISLYRTRTHRFRPAANMRQIILLEPVTTVLLHIVTLTTHARESEKGLLLCIGIQKRTEMFFVPLSGIFCDKNISSESIN